MKKIICVLSVILIVIAAARITANAQTVGAGDPTYTAVEKTDQNGLTGGYVYKFAGGEKDAAPGDCLLMIDGRFTNADVIIRNNRSFAPIRAVAEAFGAKVDWNGDTQTVSIASGSSVISMKIGLAQAVVNIKIEPLDAAPIIVNGRAYVPLRFISECLDKSVGYLPVGQKTKSGYIAAVTDKNAARGLALNPIVWVDSPEKSKNGAASDKTLAWLKTEMNRGLASLKSNIDTADSGSLKGTDINGETFRQMDAAINNTYYLGAVGRYAMYEGPYTALVDTETDSVYFYALAHGICGISKADMNSPDTFVPMYFAD